MSIKLVPDPEDLLDQAIRQVRVQDPFVSQINPPLL